MSTAAGEIVEAEARDREAEARKQATEADVGEPAVRTVRYPSIDFPVPPAMELAVPGSWRPIGAAVLNEMRTRPDVAVAGPDVVDGVRPNLMAKVSRVPVTGGTTTPAPAELLEALFAQQRTEDGAVGFEYRLHTAETDTQPYGISRYTERLGEVEVLRLTCAVIVSTGPVVHLVIVQAACSPTDPIGLEAIEAAFASLRISSPMPPANNGEGETNG